MTTVTTKKWMPFYVSAYLADTTHLRTLEHGAYALILFHLWQTRTPIKDTDSAFQRVTRTTPEQWAEMRDVILDLLTKTANGWVQKRLMIEVDRAETAYKKRVKTIGDLNNKRKGLKRSSRGKRDDDRHIIYGDDRPIDRSERRPTSTLSKERVEGEPTPSATSASSPGSGSLDAPPARPATETEPALVTVTLPSGAKIDIDRMGNFDEVWAPLDCPETRLTRQQALDLRANALATTRIPPPSKPPHADLDPERDRPDWMRRPPPQIGTG